MSEMISKETISGVLAVAGLNADEQKVRRVGKTQNRTDPLTWKY